MPEAVRGSLTVLALALCGCQLFGPGAAGPGAAGAGSPTPPASESSPAPAVSHAPGVRGAFDSRIAGSVSAPAALLPATGAGLLPATGAGYRLQEVVYRPVSQALVYLLTPDDQFYLGPTGQAVHATTDSEGRFELPAQARKPLIVAALLPGNRRLAGYAFLEATGSSQLDLSLESTYVTEYLRYWARKEGRPLESFPIEGLADLTRKTRALLDAGSLSATSDIGINAIGRLNTTYHLAFAEHGRAVSDGWCRLIGRRPLGVRTLEGSVEPGFKPLAITTLEAPPAVYVAAINSTGVSIREIGTGSLLFRGLARDGWLAVQAMRRGPDGRVYFLEAYDGSPGAAVDRSDPAAPALNLYSFAPGDPRIARARLRLPPELAAWVNETTPAAVEPTGLAWNDGKLYVTDVEAGLIYAFTPAATGDWPGEVFAGHVSGGRPRKGYRGGERLAAQFGGPTHLFWRDGEAFVTDAANHVIRRIDRLGVVHVEAGTPGTAGSGGDGGAPTEATLHTPGAVVFDQAGRMFLADGDNHRIRVVAGGRIRTVVGGRSPLVRDGDADHLEAGQILDLALDGRGNLLFTDLGVAKVRRLFLEFGIEGDCGPGVACGGAAPCGS